MKVDVPPRLRADAARNAGRILDAAGAALREKGAEASMEEIARRAGVAPATLYRRYPSRDELIRACVERLLHEEVEPALTRAQEAADPWLGLTSSLQTVLESAARNLYLVAAVGQRGPVLDTLRRPAYDALGAALRRARDHGRVRADLTEADLPHLVEMVVATMTEPTGDDATAGTPAGDDADAGWRRYLAILLDGIKPA